jgi:hypothetical protein
MNGCGIKVPAKLADGDELHLDLQVRLRLNVALSNG